MPAGVSLNLGVQVIDSTDSPGDFEAVARVCSDPLTRSELLTVGNSIAQAIYSAPGHDRLSRLMVSPWVPDGNTVQQDPAMDPINTDYHLFLWDHAGPLDSNWQ